MPVFHSKPCFAVLAGLGCHVCVMVARRCCVIPHLHSAGLLPHHHGKRLAQQGGLRTACSGGCASGSTEVQTCNTCPALMVLVQSFDIFRIINTFEVLQAGQVACTRLFDFYMTTATAGSSDGGDEGGAKLLTEGTGSSEDADAATSALLARLRHATYSWYASSEGPAAPPTALAPAAGSMPAKAEGAAVPVSPRSSITSGAVTGVLIWAARLSHEHACTLLLHLMHFASRTLPPRCCFT